MNQTVLSRLPVTLAARLCAGVLAFFAGLAVFPAAADIGLMGTDPLTDEAFATAGSFSGFFYGSTTVGSTNTTIVKGLLSLKVTSTAGKLSAQITLAGKTLALSAKAWDTQGTDGTCTAALTAKSGETLRLNVRENRAWGTLSGGSLTEALSCDSARDYFIKDGSDAPLGSYTVSLTMKKVEEDGDVEIAPDGSGYLSLSVKSKGGVKIAGMLPDGTKISSSAKLLDFGAAGNSMAVPVFAPLYSKKGWFSALVWVDAGGNAGVDSKDGWAASWRKVGKGGTGFEALLGLEGGLYSASSVPTELTFSLDGVPDLWVGDNAISAVDEALPDGMDIAFDGKKFTIEKATKPKKSDGEYEYNGETDAALKLSVTASTGLFKGSFKIYYDDDKVHKTVTVKVQGALLPSGGAGLGLVKETDPDLKKYNTTHSIGVTLE